MIDKDMHILLEQLNRRLEAEGVTLPLSADLSVLRKPLTIGSKVLPNRLAVQPMEGCDGTSSGAPDELTLRRYSRFAAGGAGLIWFEATAVVPEGRANPRQLHITQNTLDDFKRVTELIRTAAFKQNGYAPVIICQLTHSGRYSKPQGTPAPLIAYNNPVFEKDNPIDASRILSDDYLAALPEAFAAAASLASEAGFDGADIKCCHRYLLNELLSAYNRPGAYGGSFENRTRLYFESLSAARAAVPEDFIITSRLNIYDGFTYPYGFGMARDGSLEADLTEPELLCSRLTHEQGLKLLNITMGNPYVNPHVNRPYNKGPYTPPESPYKGLERMFTLTGKLAKSLPELNIVSSAHTYLRRFAPLLAAGAVEQGVSSVAGFGRMAFAYPDFARDILTQGGLDDKKCCLACGNCSRLMRAGTVAGCVPLDGETYNPYFKEHCV